MCHRIPMTTRIATHVSRIQRIRRFTPLFCYTTAAGITTRGGGEPLRLKELNLVIFFQPHRFTPPLRFDSRGRFAPSQGGEPSYSLHQGHIPQWSLLNAFKLLFPIRRQLSKRCTCAMSQKCNRPSRLGKILLHGDAVCVRRP